MHAVRLQPRSEFRQCSCVCGWVGGWSTVLYTRVCVCVCVWCVVTQGGEVYAWGEATNGRLGLGLSSGSVAVPRQLTVLSQYVIRKVAVHSGRHSLCSGLEKS